MTTTRYFVRRLTGSALLLLSVPAISFLLMDLAPGDFFDELRIDPQVSTQTIASLRSQFGLDEPAPVRYVRWLKSAAQGDWGFSFAYHSPAGTILWPRVRNTLFLSVSGTLLAWLIAIPIGVLSAGSKHRAPRMIVNAAAFLIEGIPDLVIALLFLLVALRSGWFPAGGAASIDHDTLKPLQKFADLVRHVALPAITLALCLFPLLVTNVSSNMTKVLASPFVAAAQAHGIRQWRILWRHALPAAANPLISLLGLSMGILLSASVLVEGVFSWPGLGQLLVESILNRDFYIVIDATFLGVLMLVTGGLLADVLLTAADPRIRLG